MNDTSTCASCGKEGDDLKACMACHMVKYCNRDCQIAHRPQHKKACKKRAVELYDEKLFKEVEREECPICMIPMPLDLTQTEFKSCCGKLICKGCSYTMFTSEGKDLCAFCRTPYATSTEEEIKRIKKLMDKGNSRAFNTLGFAYKRGDSGLPQDTEKANELYLKAGELGCSDGYYNLGNQYYSGRGVQMNKKKTKHYYELAAMMGCLEARHYLGVLENEVGNVQRAFRHFKLAARAGYESSINTVKRGFKDGFVTKDEYANTLRAYQKMQAEMKSDARDKAVLFYTLGEWVYRSLSDV